MATQRNYAQQMDAVLATLGDTRPRLLLHACCGPCSSAVLEQLCRYFEITVLYYNNAIGQELEAEFGVKHLPSDFKKHNGYLRSLQLSEQYGLYRQDYCGCEFSAKARGIEG